MEMKGNVVSPVIIISLLACFCLVFWSPHLMISPGKLLPGHQELTTDCFSCHSLFIGSPPEKCIICHKVDDIGLIDTKGTVIKEEDDIRISFHQELIKEDCVACHSDHQGAMKYRAIQYFFHGLLNLGIRNDCNSCHQNPGDHLHEKTTKNCSQCHSDEKWIPARFEHEFLDSSIRINCHNCHINPEDELHEKITGNCDKCHSEERWIPAVFEHDQYFQLDRDHDTECIKCHTQNEYSQYSCYVCHEHSPSKIKIEHIEEDIHDFEECTECHRSADEDQAKRRHRSNKNNVTKRSFEHDNEYDDDDDDEHDDEHDNDND
jgi:hypothetical protein